MRELASTRLFCESVGAGTSVTCVWGAQFVADGVFYAELNELLTRELAEHGYSGTFNAGQQVFFSCAWPCYNYNTGV